MTEIDEVEVISRGGIPFYYHSNSGKEQDEIYLLQASFITALTQFASELKNGQIKLISMERKHYLLTKGEEFTLIFTAKHEEGPEKLISYQPKIQEAREYLDKNLLEGNIQLHDTGSEQVDQTMTGFNQYLKDQNLIRSDDDYDSKFFRDEVNSLIFRSVGYEPGKCNIGRAERLKRLSFGLVFFVISLALYLVIVLVNLPEWTIFGLFIPNFLGFLGLLQYFYRFCTTNALNQEYDMN